VREVLLQVPRSVSLEAKVGKERHRVRDLLETDSVSPEDVLVQEALHRDLQHLLADLTERERDVILMRFGDGHLLLSSRNWAGFGSIAGTVRQIESKALQKLRQPASQPGVTI